VDLLCIVKVKINIYAVKFKIYHKIKCIRFGLTKLTLELNEESLNVKSKAVWFREIPAEIKRLFVSAEFSPNQTTC